MKGDSERMVTIFTEALKVPLEEREEFVKRLCGSNQDLQRKVEALLRAHDRLGNFLEEPPGGAADD